jgi:hypothetical protein
MKELQYAEVITEITVAQQQVPQVLEFLECGFLTEHLKHMEVDSSSTLSDWRI